MLKIKTVLFAIATIIVFDVAAASAQTVPSVDDIKKTCRMSLKGQHLEGTAKHDAVMQCAKADANWAVARAAQCQAKATEKNLVQPRLDKFMARCEAK
ncbi:MAG TPA: hypothetical protein VIJ49_04670 [Aestuariivirga sp.]